MWCSFLTHSVVFELSIYCNARFLHFAHVIMPLCCLLSFRQLYCTLWDGLAASSQKYITGWCRTLTSLRHCCNVFAIATFSSYFRQGGYVMPFVCLSACLSVCLSVCLLLVGWSVAFVCVFVCLSVRALQVTIQQRSSPNFTHSPVKNWLNLGINPPLNSDPGLF